MLNEVVDKVLTIKVDVTSGGQDLEDIVVDGQEGDIEGSSTEIVDDFVELVGATGVLVVETVDYGVVVGSVARGRRRSEQPKRGYVWHGREQVSDDARHGCLRRGPSSTSA